MVLKVHLVLAVGMKMETASEMLVKTEMVMVYLQLAIVQV
jgi:hypothetical protein